METKSKTIQHEHDRASAARVGTESAMTTVHEYMIRLRDGRMLFGYYSSEDRARLAITAYADQLTGAWKSLNPIRPDSALLSALNVQLHRSAHRAAVSDISHRATLLLDFDAACPSDVMSTDGEHEAAITQAGECSAWLVSLGWPRPKQLDSGRGCQLHALVNLPVESGTDALARDLLRALKSRYPLIDAGMHDRPRLARLPGFWNRKSPSPASDRPWRIAKLLDAGDSALVTHQQLESVVAKIGLPTLPKFSGEEKRDPAAVERTIERLAAWLDKLGVMLTEITTLTDGRTLLRLSHCPLFESHRGSSAGIGISVSGRPLNMCAHTSCGMRFSEWRDLVEKKHGVKLQLGGSGRRLVFKNGATTK
jgi:hypothetical protein